MMGLAAGNMGVKLKCLDPADDAPAAIAATHIKGHFRDAAAIQQFVSGGVDVLTVEIEHIDADALEEAARTSGISIQPTPATIRVSEARSWIFLPTVGSGPLNSQILAVDPR